MSGQWVSVPGWTTAHRLAAQRDGRWQAACGRSGVVTARPAPEGMRRCSHCTAQGDLADRRRFSLHPEKRFRPQPEQHQEPPPPSDWVDWVAVERAVQGKPVGRPLTDAEARKTATILVRRGAGPSEISQKTGRNWTRTKQLLQEVA